MKLTAGVRKILVWVGTVLLILAVVAAIYSGSIPEKYRLKAGDASPYDIYAKRSIPNRLETDLRAAKAAAEVPDVMLRSDVITNEVKAKTADFFDIIDNLRAAAKHPTPAATSGQTTSGTTAKSNTAETTQTSGLVTNPAQLAEDITLQIGQQLALVITSDDAMLYATLEDSRYNSIKGHVTSLVSLIMAQTVDASALKSALAEQMDNLKKTVTFYAEDSGIIERTLGMLLRANVVFDAVATANARQVAFDRIQNNPVMLERGTRVVSAGEIITDDTYALLRDLGLIDSGRFDFTHLFGIAALLLFLIVVSVYYISVYEKSTVRTMADQASLLLALLIPLAFSAYIARSAPLAPPVYFAAVLIASYFGFRLAAVLTLGLAIAILPMTNFSPVFLVVAIGGSLVAALFTKGVGRKQNYGLIIIATASANILLTLACGLMQKDGGSAITVNSAYTALSGALSVIAAIGIMPLFELLFNTVSPLRLIDLSQPGHPLLRRLFVEAPGTSQHSMMVANLSDAAATAIGANAMLARVGAYYHDIGKLEHPMMFTENQEGENPHDSLDPVESAEIILSHPDAGLRIGRRYRLPMPILRIIHEHHGTTAQVYFYHKAMKLAEEGAQPAPDVTRYKYHCPLPSSRESAIVMLADSVEAAMKSTGINQIDEAEKLIRRLIKTKNEQDQLVYSGMSFEDVEKLIQAFLQVYSGHFHERVKYPDDHTVRQPAG
jgi:cyclic-di-AMP phosphodiesterase PgpH